MGKSKRTDADREKERRYESAGKRPGTPISTRVSEGALAAIDAARGDQSRSAWLGDLVAKELKLNEAPKKRGTK